MKSFFTIKDKPAAFAALMFILLLLPNTKTTAQILFTIPDSDYAQDFDVFGSSSTAVFPAGFQVTGDGFWNGLSLRTACTQANTNLGLTNTSSWGVYNFGDGANVSDRALGFLSSSNANALNPWYIVVAFTNNTGSTISSIDVSFDYEKYRGGTREWNWTFYHGSAPDALGTSVPAGSHNFPADAANDPYPVVISYSKSFTLTGLSILNGQTYYFRFRSEGVGGKTNAQGIGIDNFLIEYTNEDAEDCPDFTGLVPDISITDNYWDVDCEEIEGSIAAVSNCPDGSEPVYSTDGGENYSTDIPPYPSTTITLTIACRCEDDLTEISDARNIQIVPNQIPEQCIEECPNVVEDPEPQDNPIIICGEEGFLKPAGGGVESYIVTSDLIFSKYLEGSSFNKALEIFNGTGADINLSGYEIRTYFNGQTSYTNYLLSGVLVDGQVLVLAHQDANASILAVADITINGGVVNFNGNDAVGLYYNGTLVDLIGNIGCDPGTQWSDSGNSTLNRTLVRNGDVVSGVTEDPDNTPCTFPTLATEWTVYPQDDLAGLGAHETFLELSIEGYRFYSDEELTDLLAYGDSLQLACLSADTVIVYVTAYVLGYDDAICESEPVEYVYICSAAPEVSYTVNNVTCPDGNDGSIDVDDTDDDFVWTTTDGSGLDNNTLSQTGLTAGTYILTLTNDVGCETVYTIEVEDGEDGTVPSITCPAAIEVTCIADTSMEELGEATATDNCTAVEDLLITYSDEFSADGDCETAGVLNRSWTATDESGNESACVQVITISSELNIEISGCTSLEIDILPGQVITLSPSDFGVSVIGGGCATPLLTVSPSEVSYEDLGHVTVTISASDACGNENTCVTTLLLYQSCGLDMPSDISVDLLAGECGRVISYTVGLSGSCPGLTTVVQSGFTSPLTDSHETTTSTYGSLDDPANGIIEIQGYDYTQLPGTLIINSINSLEYPYPPYNWYLYQIVEYVVPASGTLTFDWVYEAYEAGEDFWNRGGYYVGGNAISTVPVASLVQVTNNAGGINQSGSVTVDVVAGEYLMFYTYNYLGLGYGAQLRISNLEISGFGPNAPVWISGPQSGEYLEEGTYESCWAVYDDEGNVLDEQCLSIDIRPYTGPVNQNMVCNDMVNVSLGFDAENGCVTVLGADDILEGGPYRCYDDYIVQITYPQIPGINSHPEGNILDYTHIGLTLTVMVTDPVTGNRCWGKIFVEDKQAPLLQCEDLLFPCTSEYANITNPLLIQFPSNLVWPRDFITNRGQNPYIVRAGLIDCSEVELTYTDVSITLGCTEEGIWRRVIRTWVGKDIFGNVGTCIQLIDFERLTIEDVLNITGLEDGAMILVDCEDEVPGLNFQGSCNIWAGIKSELRLPLCNNSAHSYKLFREYTIFDDCTGERLDIEVIYVKMDTEAPEFVGADANGFLPEREYVSNAFSCMAEITLVPPVVTDNCSEVINVVPFIPNAQIIKAGNTYVVWLPIQAGYYYVEWVATDDCENTSIAIEPIRVRDTKAPVAVCVQYTVVSLTPTHNQGGSYDAGEGRVYATSLDNGSWDNCEIFDYKVMRMSNTTRQFCGEWHNSSELPAPRGSVYNPQRPTEPYWRDYITFCCEDLSATDPIMVVLRVRDIYGNVNYCMVNVEVQSKLPPVLTAPADVVLECRDILTEDELKADLLDEAVSIAKGYGWVSLSSMCGLPIQVTVTGSLDECGIGTLTRTFRVTVGQGAGAQTYTATQRIYVVNSPAYRFWINSNNPTDLTDDVVWPQDLEEPGCEFVTVESLKEKYGETDKVFSNFRDIPYNLRPRSMPFLNYKACSLPGLGHDDWEFELEGGCKKILRQWKVIDWCRVDASGNYYFWMYEQVIKIFDEIPAELTNIRFTVDGEVAYENEGVPTGLVVLTHQSASCSPVVAVELTAEDECQEAQLQKIVYSYRIEWGTSNTSFVSSGQVSPVVSGNLTSLGTFGYNYGIFGAELQNRIHRVLWTLDDRCGNITTITYDFVVRDGKKPSPICTDEIVAVQMINGEIEVVAAWFNLHSFDNCAGDLTFRFFSENGPERRVFTCDDFANGVIEGTQSTLTLPVYVIDASGNYDFCNNLRLTLQDNQGACGDISSVVVSGTIAMESGQGVEGVEVVVLESGSAHQVVTEVDGAYSVRIAKQLAGNTNDEVRSGKNNDLRNGVTTNDIILIQKHMLGTAVLSGPYARIAADVNADGRINSLDITELRQVLLNKRESFSGDNAGKSWKMVDSDYVFTTSTPEREDYPQFRGVDATKNNRDMNFVAVKIGDVNGTARGNQQGGGRSAMTEFIGFDLEDAQLTRGEEYAVVFRSTEMGDIAGYQYSLSFEGMEVKGVESAGHEVSESNYNRAGESLLMSWNGSETKEDELFVVYVVAVRDVKLSESLMLTPVLEAEAYTSGGEVKGLSLRFAGMSEASGYALLQNEPNPFRTETRIVFELPSEMYAKISVTDISGKVLKVIEGTYQSGRNEVQLRRGELGSAGVLQYTLETEHYRSTRKMIVIE